MSRVSSSGDAASPRAPLNMSRAAWLGMAEPTSSTGQDRLFLALDARACEYWLDETHVKAWEAVCLHARLDPLPLRWLKAFSAEIDLAAIARDHGYRRVPRFAKDQVALMDNMERVKRALVSGELKTWHRGDEGPQRGDGAPLLRLVSLEEFQPWADVELVRPGPWPARVLMDAPVNGRTSEQRLQLPVRNRLLHLVALVEGYFHDRLEQGELQTPTTQEILCLLVDLNEPCTGRQAVAIAALLRPDNTPRGPRRRQARSRA